MTEEDNNESIDDVCEECKKEDESVSQNLILTGYKLCNSCRISKTIFPLIFSTFKEQNVFFSGTYFSVSIKNDLA